MKCPACGFDSPEGAQWCELCKEPFNKRRRDAAAKAADPASPAAAGRAAEPARTAVPADVLAKLEAVKTEAAERAAKAEIPSEFAHLDSGEGIPSLPAWVKPLAWTILGIWVVVGMILAGVFLAKKRAIDDSPAGTAAPEAKPLPGDSVVHQSAVIDLPKP